MNNQNNNSSDNILAVQNVYSAFARRDIKAILEMLSSDVDHTKCFAKPTGKTYDTDFVHLFTFREGKIIRFKEFFDTYIAGEAFRP
jgi:ketosteroid isomerase-like protein